MQKQNQHNFSKQIFVKLNLNKPLKPTPAFNLIDYHEEMKMLDRMEKWRK